VIVPVLGELTEGGLLKVALGGGNDWDAEFMGTRLRSLTPAFEAVKGEPLAMTTGLSWAAVNQLARAFPGARSEADSRPLAWTPGPLLCSWIMGEAVRRSCEGDFTGQPPAREPMTHQVAGAIAIGMNGRFLLADEPGTGKTQTAAMGLAELDARGRFPFPALVVAPASVVDSWLEDLALTYPGWKVMPYMGASRQRLLRSDAQVLVTSWETMRNDTGDSRTPGPLMRHGFSSLVGDEAHKTCNYESRQSVRFRRLASHTPVVIEATGTPTNNNAGNFWPLINSMHPSAFPSRDRYKEHYCLGRRADYGDTEVTGLRPEMEPEFRAVMQGAMRRVAKADVLAELPPKTYQTRWMDIPAKYRPAYDEMEADMLAHLPDTETPLTAMNTLAKMMRLSQLAHAACDVEAYTELDDNPKSLTYGQEVEKLKVTMREPSWKVDALMEILDELHEGDAPLTAKGDVDRRRLVHGSRPVVAFAPLKQLVMLAGARAEAQGYKVGYIVGGMTAAARTATRHAFQAHELDLLCVTTAAGGVGLTLTAADTAVFLMRPWGLVEATQSEDRLHRRGQTGNVLIIDLVTRKSIESRIRTALKGKAQNLAELVQDPRIARELFGGA
jgi:SNF2 family DNA or RNA helicase